MKLCCGLVAACAAAASTTVADTLVISYSGASTVDIPNEFADLHVTLASEPGLLDFEGQLLLPNYENYQTGTQVIEINTNGFQMSLASGVLGPMEGTRTFSFDESNYDPNLPNFLDPPALGVSCNDVTGCDVYDDSTGERYPRGPGVVRDNIIDSPYNPRPFVGIVNNPSDSQNADFGTLTLENGVPVSFTWGSMDRNSDLLGSYNYGRPLVPRNGEPFAVVIDSMQLDLTSFSAPVQVGDTFLVQAIGVDGQASLGARIPEPGATALAVITGIVAAGFRRRQS